MLWLAVFVVIGMCSTKSMCFQNSQMKTYASIKQGVIVKMRGSFTWYLPDMANTSTRIYKTCSVCFYHRTAQNLGCIRSLAFVLAASGKCHVGYFTLRTAFDWRFCSVPGAIVQHIVVYDILYYTILYYTMLYYTVLYCSAVQSSLVQSSIVQYSIVALSLSLYLYIYIY